MAYEIQFITDTRFNGTKQQLIRMDKELKRKISKMDGVNLRTRRPIYELDWSRESPDEPHKQWRITYVVSKVGRNYSWNDIMGEINEIQAPYYKKV